MAGKNRAGTYFPSTMKYGDSTENAPAGSTSVAVASNMSDCALVVTIAVTQTTVGGVLSA